MEHPRQPSSSKSKVERRVIEKNRRNHMKILFSKLNSLIPNFNPGEPLPLPDQIDEAINYIKSLETKVKIAKEKKDSLALMRRKRPRACSSTSIGALQTPQIEIRELGSAIEVVLTNSQDNEFVFCEVIRILHEEDINVISANSSIVGDLMFHVVHAEVGESSLLFGDSKVSQKLKRFIYGSLSDMEILPEPWDFGIDTNVWEF